MSCFQKQEVVMSERHCSLSVVFFFPTLHGDDYRRFLRDSLFYLCTHIYIYIYAYVDSS